MANGRKLRTEVMLSTAGGTVSHEFASQGSGHFGNNQMGTISLAAGPPLAFGPRKPAFRGDGPICLLGNDVANVIIRDVAKPRTKENS
ncbi:hypothetical protein QQP08_017448 [Theobroma cacao]|nr:hypothetical protein QQP08_017448 [Theobroma cacao]